jgi:hypothetical protein
MKSPRTLRRKLARQQEKLGDKRDKLARSSAGGSAELPLAVGSASAVEAKAAALGCARCGGELALEAHDALTTRAGPRRLVKMRCRACRAIREIWLVVGEVLH